MHNRTMKRLAAAVLLVAVAIPAVADDRVVVDLVTDGLPDGRDIGVNYNIFSAPDDRAIYYSATDWLTPDGLVEMNFGMSLANYYADQPGGFDKQVKHLHEYDLQRAYDLGITDQSLVSASLRFGVDRVIDMTLSGLTDVWAPEYAYIAVFNGDGLLTTELDAQPDFDQCDRQQPSTWHYTVHLVSPQGYRITDDEILNSGGLIEFEVDVTGKVTGLFVSQEPFAGFTVAASHDADFTLTSMDGGYFPTLRLVGPLLGDFTLDDQIDMTDFAYLQNCFSGADTAPVAGCLRADLEQDDDVDIDDFLIYQGYLAGPIDGRGGEGPTSHDGEVTVTGGAQEQPLVRSRNELGDFNADGEVDLADAKHFDACIAGRRPYGECQRADLNGDGQLDQRDVRLFGQLFGR